MLNELEWLHDLNIKYDASTFDTDPFEPQPDAVDTIFPFWMPSPEGHKSPRGGYVELPYTLPQDSTLFLLLREHSIDVWKKKSDWVARNGGMLLLDTHPDYMTMEGGSRKRGEYPVGHYEDFLLLCFVQLRPKILARSSASGGRLGAQIKSSRFQFQGLHTSQSS